MTAAPIAFEALTKTYGQIVAVDDLSFEVRPGRVTGLLGRNGAGKTTSLRVLLGLARPTSGRTLLLGAPYHELADARRVGVSLDGINALPGATAAGELRIWATALGLPLKRVDLALDEVGMTEVAGRKIRKLSQGMRQRLALATAFLSDPEVLILDEPANGLDPAGIRWLRGALRSRAERGVTVLVSSHLLSEVEDTVDDVVILDKTLRYSGPIADLTDGGAQRLEAKFFELVEGDAVSA